jgi:probable DNA repair protein
LLNLTASLAAALDSGATLVVPSRQRAAAVRLAVASEARRRARRVWRSPDVLPWQGWLTREFEAQRHALEGGRRLLRPTEAWFIWQGIAARLAETHGLLAAGALAASLPRALALQRDWGLRWRGDAGPEADLLRDAAGEWHRAWQGLEAIDTGDWSALPGSPSTFSPSAVLLAGFPSIGAARRAWLDGRGITTSEGPGGPLAPVSIHGAADPAGEFRAAATWCLSRLAADPGARLLVIVPGLAQQRARLQRIFSEVLDADATASGSAAYAIEGGQPLAQFPLVRVALSLLALEVGPLRFDEFSALLRTSYLALGTLEARTRLELWLRDRGRVDMDSPGLRALLPAITRELGTAAGEVAQRLLADTLKGGSTSDSAGGWARRYAARLHSFGWPGTLSLGSEEQQVRRRFDELLGEYAACGGAAVRRDAATALRLLQTLAHDTAFEPATDDLPVTISARADDPLVRYDGIWVCGCDAARLPAPPAAEAFIPLGVQLAAGIPAASAEGQLALARAALGAWRAATPELILSWARTDEDAEQGPSSLLAGGTSWDGAPPEATVGVAGSLASIADADGPPWPRGRRLRGGVQALQWQAECPFRAFAQLRLGAVRMAEPAAGVDPRLRGRVLHRALEALWRDLGDSAALQALGPAEQSRRVAAALDAALQSELRDSVTGLPPLLQAAERRRSALVIGALLDTERTRAAFRVLATEVQRPLALGGLELGLRLDRVDALGDGGVAILDYKTGRPEAFDPQAERQRRPQLPGYALAWGEDVAALATVHLRRDGVTWRGVADADGRLPQLRSTHAAAGAWSGLRAHWRASLGALLAELAAGSAPVAPLAGACAHCHLAALCRIDAARLAAADGRDGEDGDGG